MDPYIEGFLKGALQFYGTRHNSSSPIDIKKEYVANAWNRLARLKDVPINLRTVRLDSSCNPISNNTMPNDQLVLGWDYPPGVTSKDIDKHFGDAPQPQCVHCTKKGDWEKLDKEFVCPRCLANMD